MTLGADGKVVRHGWREAGGTRRVGSYGHVFHSGACFGVGWLPYEVSSDCTTAFVEHGLFPMGVNAQGYLTHLATRPALVYEGATWAANFTEVRNAPGCRGHRGGSDYWDGYYRWSLKLRDGDPAVPQVLSSTDSVDAALATLLARAERVRNAIAAGPVESVELAVALGAVGAVVVVLTSLCPDDFGDVVIEGPIKAMGEG